MVLLLYYVHPAILKMNQKFLYLSKVVMFKEFKLV